MPVLPGGRGAWEPRRVGSRQRAAAIRQRVALSLIAVVVVVTLASLPAEPPAQKRQTTGSRWSDDGTLQQDQPGQGGWKAGWQDAHHTTEHHDALQWAATPADRESWMNYKNPPFDMYYPPFDRAPREEITVSLPEQTYAYDDWAGNQTAYVYPPFGGFEPAPYPCGPTGMQIASRTKSVFDLCVYSQEDVISSFFIQDGKWRDCRDLPQLYEASLRAGGKKRKSGVVVDVGANIGTCAMELAAMGARVLAFEPVRSNFDLLNRSVALNGFQHVELYQVALGFQRGVRPIMKEVGNMGNAILTTWDRIHDNDRWYRTAFEKEDVTLARLDDFVAEHVNLLKLDCQGYEVRVLRGATNLMKRYGVDRVRAEVDPKLLDAVGDTPRDLFEFLHDLGFDVNVVDDSEEFEGSHPPRWLKPSEYAEYSERLVQAETSTHVNATRSYTPRQGYLSRYSVEDGEVKPDVDNPRHLRGLLQYRALEAAGLDLSEPPTTPDQAAVRPPVPGGAS